MKTFAKYALILAFSGLTLNNAHSKTNPLLHCLAKEEENFHKTKNVNIYYRLNQEFVNELASSTDILFKKKYVDRVCGGKEFTPSVELLRILLINETEVYDFSDLNGNSNLRAFRMNYVNEFQKQVPRIFAQFISGLQSEMPTATCMNDAIPELSGLFEKIKYLEDEVSTKNLLSQKTRIETIFNKLKKIKTIKRNCEVKANQQKKNS